MENKKTVCKYKDKNSYIMVCEKETQVVDTEEIEVPIVGDTEESYVEPLGETESWYPENTANNNIVNYQYGTTSQYTASLIHPEEGITASDIVLITIIALSVLAVATSIAVLAGRGVHNRAQRKDFVQE